MSREGRLGLCLAVAIVLVVLAAWRALGGPVQAEGPPDVVGAWCRSVEAGDVEGMLAAVSPSERAQWAPSFQALRSLLEGAEVRHERIGEWRVSERVRWVFVVEEARGQAIWLVFTVVEEGGEEWIANIE